MGKECLGLSSEWQGILAICLENVGCPIVIIRTVIYTALASYPTTVHADSCPVVDLYGGYFQRCYPSIFRSLTGRSQSPGVPTALLSLIGAKLSWQLALSR